MIDLIGITTARATVCYVNVPCPACGQPVLCRHIKPRAGDDDLEPVERACARCRRSTEDLRA